MEAHTGKMPIIYTDMTFHRDVLAGLYFDNAFWLRSVAAEPDASLFEPRLHLLAVDADRHRARAFVARSTATPSTAPSRNGCSSC